METVGFFTAHQVNSRSEFRSPSMSPAKVKYNRQISGSPSGVELFDFFQEATFDPQSVINQDQGSIESSFSNKALGFLVGSDRSSEHHTAQKLDFVGPAEDASELFKLGGTGTHILSSNQISNDFDPPKCGYLMTTKRRHIREEAFST